MVAAGRDDVSQEAGMNPLVAVLMVLALPIGAGALLGWLKGTLYLVAYTFRELASRRGEPRTWMALFGPEYSIPLVFVSSALGLAHPDSWWAGRFYSPVKLARAATLHGIERLSGGDG